MGTPRTRPHVAALATLLVLLAAPSAARGQGSGALTTTVTSAATGEVLPGARVQVEGTGASGVTDARGVLHLPGIPAGPRTVRVTLLGYEPYLATVPIPRDGAHPLAVGMVVQPIPIDPLRATAAAADATWGLRMLESRGFYERKEGGVGVFLTRDQITRQNHRSLSQLLSRHARLNVAYEAFGTRSPGRPNRQGTRPVERCQPEYFLDGVQVDYFDVNSVHPGDIEGLEIYRGASEVPAVFNRAVGGCGVVVIWTRVH